METRELITGRYHGIGIQKIFELGGGVPWNMETRDHRAGRYHEIWRQEVVELGGSMEYGDKRS